METYPEPPEYLIEKLNEDRKNFTIYPSNNLLFKAFELCSLNEIKVVILGQDPYHQPGQANGLAFSVNPDQSIPPSLNNIGKELYDDLKIKLKNGDLSHWAKNGVLLLNTILAVRRGKPNYYKNCGWEEYTDSIISLISKKCDKVVFMLWGNNAKQKKKLIDSSKHLILESGHPSPMSANRGLWFGNKHFSKAENFLNIKIFN